MKDIWLKRIKLLDYAFQPIVNPYTGVTFGVEALLRNTDKIGYNTIHSFFDHAYEERLLFELDILLREKAIEKFTKIDTYNRLKLFYNYDPRVLEMQDYKIGFTENILNKYSLNSNLICFEINEKYQISNISRLKEFINNLKKRGIKIALDDFGSGFAGLELFYHSEPEYLKFDRFLITGINNDIKKKSFCSHIINLCKLFGIIVIAEGIETMEELYTCKDLGFDLVQGYYILEPQIEIQNIELINIKIKNLVSKRKSSSSDEELISNEIIKLDSINIESDIKIIFEKFHEKSNYNFFPVVDSNNYPMGILHEKDIKKYVYSPYGKDILCNKSINYSINRFISFCPVVDLNSSQEMILEVFVNNPDSEGVLLTKEMKYIGFLNAKSLLKIINQKNLTYAREINPLSKLPGNILINKFINNIMNEEEFYFYLIYFDFDNFKPFNDRFGFRQEDRAILYFAELLNKEFNTKDFFVGHIGGDDFFVGYKTIEYSKDLIFLKTEKIVNDFSESIRNFYPFEDINNGYYISKNRNGEIMKFEFLTVSTAIIEIKSYERKLNIELIDMFLSELKKVAKNSESKIAFKELICDCLVV